MLYGVGSKSELKAFKKKVRQNNRNPINKAIVRLEIVFVYKTNFLRVWIQVRLPPEAGQHEKRTERELLTVELVHMQEQVLATNQMQFGKVERGGKIEQMKLEKVERGGKMKQMKLGKVEMGGKMKQAGDLVSHLEIKSSGNMHCMVIINRRDLLL